MALADDEADDQIDEGLLVGWVMNVTVMSRRMAGENVVGVKNLSRG